MSGNNSDFSNRQRSARSSIPSPHRTGLECAVLIMAVMSLSWAYRAWRYGTAPSLFEVIPTVAFVYVLRCDPITAKEISSSALRSVLQVKQETPGASYASAESTPIESFQQSQESQD